MKRMVKMQIGHGSIFLFESVQAASIVADILARTSLAETDYVNSKYVVHETDGHVNISIDFAEVCTKEEYEAMTQPEPEHEPEQDDRLV